MVHNMTEQRLMLEVELIQVRSAIQELNQRELQLRYKINQCCPISKLHPEILLRIFMATFPQNSFSSWGFATPLLLGAICHGWRELAWSYPLLWSSVSLTVKHYTTTKNDLLQEWLARSSDLPLSIQFHMRKPVADIPKERCIVWKSMDIIARCSERWQNIDLSLLVMFHPKLCFAPTRVPLLVSASLHELLYKGPYTEFIDNLPDFQVVWDAPNLRHVHFGKDRLREEPLLVLPLKQITTLLHCGESNGYEFIEALEGAPNLSQCKFDYIVNMDRNYDMDRYDEGKPVTAPQLKKLEFGCNDCNLSVLFNNLTIPVVHDLSISSQNRSPQGKHPFPSTAFTSLISRSGCNLMRLSLSCIALPADDLARCFSAIPSLIELSLDTIVTMDETLRGLTVYQNSQDILLPNLERLICIHRDLNQRDRSAPDLCALAVMAKSRWGYGPRTLASSKIAQLKLIHVEIQYFHFSLYDSNEQRIKELEEIGPGDSETLGKIRCIDRNRGFRCYKPIHTVNERHIAEDFKELVAEGMDIRIQSVALFRG